MKICGMDANYLFAFYSEKYVRIPNWRLGVLRLVMIAFILAYIIVFSMFYQGNHLAVLPCSGTYRLQLQEPTLNCNPMVVNCQDDLRPKSQLSYCKKENCKWMDGFDVELDHQQGVFIPTHVQEFAQRRVKDLKPDQAPTKIYTYVNRSHFEQTGDHRALPMHSFFIAEVERFTLMLDHSVAAGNDDMSLDDGEMRGILKACNGTVLPIVCSSRTEQCPQGSQKLEQPGGITGVHLEGEDFDMKVAAKNEVVESSAEVEEDAAKKPATASRLLRSVGISLKADEPQRPAGPRKPKTVTLSDTEVPIKIERGDVFPLDMLLKAAGLEFGLDNVTEESDDVGGIKTIRRSGAVVKLDIRYTNRRPWIGLKVGPMGEPVSPRYTINVKLYKDYMKMRKVVGRPSSKQRIVRDYHGVLLLIEQSGEYFVWDTTKTLLVLCTSLSLVTLSTLTLDYLLLFGSAGELYESMKYHTVDEKTAKELMATEAAEADAKRGAEPEPGVELSNKSSPDVEGGILTDDMALGSGEARAVH